MTARVRGLGPAGLATAGLFALLFLPDLLGGRVFAFRDVVNYHLPVARVVSEELRAGRIPHWNPYLSCGTPLAANPNHYFWYPTRALDLVFSPETAMQIHLIGHWAAGGLAMAGLALLLGASAAAATAAAIAWLLAGPALSLLNFANLVPFLLWIPATSAAAIALARRPGPRRAAALAVCLAIQTTFAEPGLLLVEAAAVAAALAFDDRRERGALRRALPWAGGAVGVALLLAAPVWVPTVRLVAESARGGDFRADLRYSVRPAELLHLGIPQLFGDYHTFEKRTWWAETFHDGRGPFFLSLALGTTALAIGAAGVAARGRRGAALALVGLLGLALSMGALLPPLRPLVFSEAGRWLRWPVKLTLLPAALLPLAVAAGVDALARRERAGPAVVGGVAAALLAAGAIVLATHFGETPAAWVRDALGPIAAAKDGPTILERAARACARSGAAAAALAVVALVLATGRGRPRARAILAFVLPGLIVAEMAMPQREVNRGIPREIVGAASPVLTKARELAGETGRIHFPIEHWEVRAERRPGDPDEWGPRVALDREIGSFYHGLGEGIPTVLVDPDRLVSRGAAERARIAPLLAPADRERLLRLIGVVAEVRIGRAALEADLPPIPSRLGWPLSFAIDSAAVPVVHRAPENPDRGIAGDPWTGDFLRVWDEAIAAVREEGEVEVLERSPGRWVIETNGPAGRVGLTESRVAGWRARVDGEPTEIEPYLQDFQAVRVAAGPHRVEWTWRPPNFPGLLALAALGAALTVGGAWRGGREAAASRAAVTPARTSASRSARG